MKTDFTFTVEAGEGGGSAQLNPVEGMFPAECLFLIAITSLSAYLELCKKHNHRNSLWSPAHKALNELASVIMAASVETSGFSPTEH